MSLNRQINKATTMKIARNDYCITTRSMQYMESMLESDVCLMLDFDKTVTAFTTQPESLLNPSMEGNWRQYTPDLLIEYGSDYKRGETKPEARTHSDKFKQKHALHKSIVREQTGTELELFTEPDVHPQRLIQLRQLKAFHRFEAIPTLNQQIIQFIESRGGVAKLEELESICEQHKAWVSYPMVMLAHQVIRSVAPHVITRSTVVEVAA